jgi:hypothetical protein
VPVEPPHLPTQHRDAGRLAALIAHDYSRKQPSTTKRPSLRTTRMPDLLFSSSRGTFSLTPRILFRGVRSMPYTLALAGQKNRSDSVAIGTQFRTEPQSI